jgi:hypothetical protein
MAAGGVWKLWGILFTLVGLTAVICLCIWTLEGLVFIQEPDCTPPPPPPPPKPLHKRRYICCHLVTAHFSQLTNRVLTQLVFWLLLLLELTVCWNINTGLWRKNYFFTRKVSGVLYLYKCNVKKSEILTNIDVYSYRRPHRHASCSAGVICRGCGVVTCNTPPSIYL